MLGDVTPLPLCAIALAMLASACGSGKSAAPPAASTKPVEPATPVEPAPQAASAPACGADCAAQPLASPLPAGAAQVFGESFATDPASDVDIAALIAAPDRFGSDEPLTVRGEVTAVCQARGCWLEVAAKGESAGCRVTSERHDWLVPRDSIGATARVRGRVQVRTIPAEQVAHMEAEGGHFASKQPDGSARELRLIATGVALAR